MDYKEASNYLNMIGYHSIVKEASPEDVIDVANQLKKDNDERYHVPSIMEFLKILIGK
ncbi:MAG TPA: hypothetical protein VIM42_11435 [Clostridium sp.]